MHLHQYIKSSIILPYFNLFEINKTDFLPWICSSIYQTPLIISVPKIV